MTPEKLRELRKAAGLSQAALADLLGLDRTTITRAEKGERRVDMVLLARWAAACGSTLDLSQQAPTTAHEALVATLDHLAPDDIALLTAISTLLPALSGDNKKTLSSLIKSWSVKEL